VFTPCAPGTGRIVRELHLKCSVALCTGTVGFGCPMMLRRRTCGVSHSNLPHVASGSPAMKPMSERSFA
jgi:hypothetical protein